MVEKTESEAEAGDRSLTWSLLAFAIVLEVIGAISLRYSEGFSLLMPTLIAVSAFAMALFLVSRIMKKLPVSVAYPIWAGGGTVGVALVGVIALGEEMNLLKAVGVVLVVIGVVVINMVSEKTSGC